MRFSYLRCDSR